MPIIFSLTRAFYNCASPDEFDRTDPDLKASLKSALLFQVSKKEFLHQLMFEFAAELDSGSFGEVRHFSFGDRDMVIKKITPRDTAQIPLMRKEVEVLKVLCDLKPEEVYKNLEKCNSKVIAGFYGCVEEGTDLYIFQEKMDMELVSQTALKMYQDLTGKEKLEVMLQIISKFEELHKKQIIHSDIKPGNLMIKGKDLSDIRIIDLGMSNYQGENSAGGTRYFISPEHTNGGKLGVEGDIYSLAVTFAMIEPSMGEIMNSKMGKGCFDLSRPVSDSCVKQFREGVMAIFSRESNNESFVKVMSQAIDEDPRNRFDSMKKFGEEIQKAFEGRPTVSVNKAPVEKEKMMVEFFMRLNRYGYREAEEISASKVQNRGSDGIKNRILTEREGFGSKMLV